MTVRRFCSNRAAFREPFNVRFGLRFQPVDAGSHRSLLVAHNIDLAGRVPVGMGDRVQVRGMFEWNELGGLVHWTHHDPHGVEHGGYVRYRTRVYD